MENTDDPQLTIQPEPQADGTVVLKAGGEIDIESAPLLTAAIDAAIEGGSFVVVLDARGLSFVDSSGLRAIIDGANRLAARGGGLTIDGMTGSVARVLEVTGLLERYRHS